MDFCPCMNAKKTLFFDKMELYILEYILQYYCIMEKGEGRREKMRTSFNVLIRRTSNGPLL